ncbi:MAG TPA: hypothetical protein VNC60_04595 [Actinomycetota bacterium]|nr:hypothetical protein [Actinomycetota bacterium]
MSDRRDRIDGQTPRSDLDEVMRLTAVVGFVALTTWTLTSSVGVLSGYLTVSPPATLRFLAAVAVLVFARRALGGARVAVAQASCRRAVRILDPACRARPQRGDEFATPSVVT